MGKITSVVRRAYILDLKEHHRSSISLEPEFWSYLESKARQQNTRLTYLIRSIYLHAHRSGARINFSSYLRVYCLKSALEQRTS